MLTQISLMPSRPRNLRSVQVDTPASPEGVPRCDRDRVHGQRGLRRLGIVIERPMPASIYIYILLDDHRIAQDLSLFEPPIPPTSITPPHHEQFLQQARESRGEGPRGHRPCSRDGHWCVLARKCIGPSTFNAKRYLIRLTEPRSSVPLLVQVLAYPVSLNVAAGRHDDPEEKRADMIRAEIMSGHRFHSFANQRSRNFVKWCVARSSWALAFF